MNTSRAMRFAYADPPYPGKAHYYPERDDVDHRALVERLACEFADGWGFRQDTPEMCNSRAMSV